MTVTESVEVERGGSGEGAPVLTGPDPRRFLALAVIALAQLMIVLDASVVIVALPSAQRALHISVANRQWVMTAYTLAFGGLLLIGGRIADYMGRRRVFVIGLLGFAAASALGGLAQSSAMLLGARALQGSFAAVMAPAALSLITTTFTEPHERARAFGVYGAIAGGGAAIGLVLGGTLTQYASWRWTLLINVPIAILAAVAALRVVRPSSRVPSAGYDIPGALMATFGVFLLVYGFSAAASNGWGAPRAVGTLAAAVVMLIAFVAVELRSANPLLPLRIVADRNRGGAYLVSLMVGSAMLGTFLFLTYIFQGIFGYSAVRAGFAFLPLSGGIIVGATIASRVLPRVGPRTLMMTGLGLGTVGLLLLTRLHPASTYLSDVLPAELVVSLGMGLTFVPMSSTALIGVDPSDAGVASALANATQQVGSSLGTALLNTVAATVAAGYLAAHLHQPGAVRAASVHGYTTGFMVSASLLAAAFATTALLVRVHRSDSAAAELAVEPPAMTAEPAVARELAAR